MHHQVFTFGYHCQSIDALHRFVRATGAVLVDVRYQPVSRLATWSKGNLARRFGDAYLHQPGLGNIRYRMGPPIEFADLDAGMVKLLDLVNADRVTIVMCACASSRMCHRAAVAAELRERGIESRELLLGSDL